MSKNDTKEEPSEEEAKPVENQEKPKCFVIMPISDKEPYGAGHFKRVYNEIIIPAVKAAGYEPKRADDTNQSHLIMLDILKSIVNYDMAICDVSGFNPNVLYELGIRQMARKPVVLIQDNDERLFDISGINALRYDSNLRVDLVREAIANIKNALINTKDNYDNKAGSLIDLLGIDVQIKKTEVTLTEGEQMILDEFKSMKSLIQKQSMTSKDVIDLQIVESRYLDRSSRSLSRGDFVIATKSSNFIPSRTYYVINRISGSHLALWRLSDLKIISTPLTKPEGSSLDFEILYLSIDEAKERLTDSEFNNLVKLDSQYLFNLFVPF